MSHDGSPILGNEHHPPLESLAARAWACESILHPPRKSAIPPRGGLSGPGIRRYLGNKLSKLRLWPRIAPPLLGPGGPPTRLPLLVLSYLCLSVAPATATPGSDKRRRRPHRLECHRRELAAQDTHEPIRRARSLSPVRRSRRPRTQRDGLPHRSGRRDFHDRDPRVDMPRDVARAAQAASAATHHFELETPSIELPRSSSKGRAPLRTPLRGLRATAPIGMGAFLTQERIDRANTASLVDVLATVRGVQQVCIANQCVAKMVRSPAGCYPQYYLDGKNRPPTLHLTPPQDVKGRRDLPCSSRRRRVSRSNSGCGVIAIWTKSAPNATRGETRRLRATRRLLLVGLFALVACRSTGRERPSPGAPAGCSSAPPRTRAGRPLECRARLRLH